MQTKTIARLGAVMFVAVAVTAAALQTRTVPGSPAPETQIDLAEASTDPLRAALAHCQSLGTAAADDRDCLRAWAENRRRFLAPGARPEAAINPAGGGNVTDVINGTPSTVEGR
ncbi:MAG: conjugal transfer protein TrbK [Bradyrhizobium sp.]|nr:conjugal transfer protein TrbK [Bradyrhizobium sp.]